MQHLNYCRQAIKALVDGEGAFAVTAKRKVEFGEYLNSLGLTTALLHAPKFSLPHNGQFFEDSQMKGLRSIDFAPVPFNPMILEFSGTLFAKDAGMVKTKNIVYMGVTEVDGASEIAIITIRNSSTMKRWVVVPPITIPHKVMDTIEHWDKEKAFFANYSTFLSEYVAEFDRKSDILAGVAPAIYGFFNALACKNVHIEKSPAKSTKQGKKVKAALPFDDYHFLTVDVPGKNGVRGEGFGGSHRSPREHLRRGHIRRLESGPIWVNACVVNAGIGSKVGKSYLVRRAQ